MAGRGGPQHIPRPDGWVHGGAAPWNGVAPAPLDLVRVREALTAAPGRPSPVERPGMRASAVLVPLYEHDGDLWVVLTRRSQHLRAHRGEVSFPGGGQEADDPDLVATALREAQEEIGLDPETVDIIGELDHLTTVSSQAFIVPYVGALPARPTLTANPNEVERILHVRVAELLLEEVYREEVWRRGDFERPIWFFELHGDTIWGATAAMLRELLSLVIDAGPT
jgi:8-oxo-dGTP pyrophosphatase MutT (NUDIX family)